MLPVFHDTMIFAQRDAGVLATATGAVLRHQVSMPNLGSKTATADLTVSVTIFTSV